MLLLPKKNYLVDLRDKINNNNNNNINCCINIIIFITIQNINIKKYYICGINIIILL